MRHPNRDHELVVVACLLFTAACEPDFRVCDTPRAALSRLPARLSETGLYADITRDVLAEGIQSFTPRFALWSDGATKRRFVALPDDTQIDTRDMDDWQFPEGTKLWKEFTRDGIRVETRLEQKLGPAASDWGLIAYVWNDEQTEAFAATDGQQNVLGTAHDVPRAADCLGCHAGRKSRVLGFSALQLAAATESELSLDTLLAERRLSDPPATAIDVPGDPVQVAGLGYLHANCSHCHNKSRPDSEGSRCYEPNKSFDFALRVNELRSVASTATVRTAVGGVIRPERVDHSKVLEHMRVRDPDLPSMPPLGTEVVDSAGIEAVRAFIQSLR